MTEQFADLFDCDKENTKNDGAFIIESERHHGRGLGPKRTAATRNQVGTCKVSSVLEIVIIKIRDPGTLIPEIWSRRKARYRAWFVYFFLPHAA